MSKPNTYPGTCTCGTKVAKGAGFLGPKVGGKWTVKCSGCNTPTVRSTYRSPGRYYNTTDGGRVWYSDDTDDAYDAMKDGYIY